VERHGRHFHLDARNMTRAERWFERHGALAVLLGRITPLVRSFISIPAGLFAEPLARYVWLTAVGSAIWCFGFAGLGWGVGAGYKSIDHATHFVEGAVLLGAAGLATWLWLRHDRVGREATADGEAARRNRSK
jgi:membrane protein DedA with SNARE-associated domain